MTNLRWNISAVLTILFVCAVPAAHSTDILSQIHPYITITEEYSDNINLTKNSKAGMLNPDLTRLDKKEDFMTTVRPGIKFSNMDAQSGVDLDASAGYVFYAHNENLDYLTANVSASAKYLTSSHFNFYIRNSFIRSDMPREREPFTTGADNKYLLATENQRNVYIRNVVEPTVEYQFGPESRVGVKYRNNYYQDKDVLLTDGSVTNNDSIENYINPFLVFWITKQHGISLDYSYTNGYFKGGRDPMGFRVGYTNLNGHKVGGSYMLRFTPRATAFVKGAYTSQTFNDETIGYMTYSRDYMIYDAAVGLSYMFSPTLTASAEAGYFWMDPRDPQFMKRQDGVSFKADIVQLDARTTYRLSIQGGYTQDFFTSQNLGFRRYYRATGSITHFLERRLSIGCLGSIEYGEMQNEWPNANQLDTIWMAGANIAYTPFKWLRIALDYNYQERLLNRAFDPYEENEYQEHRAMLTFTATY